MPRRARMSIAGYPLHILQRGHNKQACFEDERDYLLYLSLLRESTALYPCAVHAFVLMTNHVHLLASPADAPNVSRAMLHRAQPGSCRNGTTSGRLPMVQLQS